MADRRALIIGSWLARGRDRPTASRVRGLAGRWVKALSTDPRYSFGGLVGPNTPLEPLYNPTAGTITAQIFDAARVTVDTEVLVYFLGHSVSVGDLGVELILKTDADGEDVALPISTLLQTITAKNFGSIVLVLDTCHAGRARFSFEMIRARGYAMFSAGSGYAFDANFSEMLLRSFEAPLARNDQRIDRRAGGITWKKLFQQATSRLLLSAGEMRQQPEDFGDHGSKVVIPSPPVVGNAYNTFASARTIYGRTYAVLRAIEQHRLAERDLTNLVRGQPAFIISHDTGRSVSRDRIADYLSFLRKAGWIGSVDGYLVVSPEGQRALDQGSFNRILLTTIEEHFLPGGLDLEGVDALVKELLDDMIPPTPAQLRQRAAMSGVELKLDPSTLLALSLLPSTGRFLKGGADTMFPADPGAGVHI